MGYAQAGFVVTGVDIAAQPDYPFRFLRADVLALFSQLDMSHYDAFHASPPCQTYSAMTACRPGLADSYPDLIAPVRDLLTKTGKPYVIENVAGSPLHNPIELCGRSFGLPLYRHRLFESNIPLQAPPHAVHDVPTSDAGHWRPGTIMSVVGHCAPIALARRAMGIGWMRREELVEAIPPAYTRHIGLQLRAHLAVAA
jgi:DNA (cytosine-5)-methyltransferase 1